ncbi:MAG: hypothetical protein L6Q97_27600, partial [Thermoanaerobaculia bacterium]|nr:hypothetical protein [Thermoanaerobaculia bacterium]
MKKLLCVFLLFYFQNLSAQQNPPDTLAPQVLREVTIRSAETPAMGLTRLRAVEGMAIYEGKKSEVVQLDAITANTATNNARQVFARVAGLNIWESDGAGLQLGIGGR